MRICNIYIEEYGALKDRSFELSPGLNLMIGENEAGKSTLCAFIKFIFYGHSDVREREARSSLATGSSAGALTLLAGDGKLYRIERRESDGRSKASVFCETDSEIFKDWKKTGSPGEYFLGIPEMLYTRSIFISQSDTPQLDRKSAEAVYNLLSSGSESLNIRRAKNNLDMMRKEYRHLRGRTGLIPETEDKLADIRRRSQKAVEKKITAEELESRIHRAEADKAELEKQLSDADAAEKESRKIYIASIVSELGRTSAALSECAARRSSLNTSVSHGDFIPDSTYVSEVCRLARELEYTEKALKTLGTVPENSPVKPRGYELFSEYGENRLISRFSDLLGSLRRTRSLFFSLLAATIVLFSVSFLALGNIVPISPAPLFVSGAVTAALTLPAFILYLKAKRSFSDFSVPTGSTDLREINSFCQRCQDFNNALQTHENHKRLLNETTAEANRKKDALSTALALWGKDSTEAVRNDFLQYNSELSALDTEAAALADRKRSLEIRLSGFSETETAEARKLVESENIPDGEALKSQNSDIAALNTRLSDTEAQLNSLRIEAARLHGSDTDDVYQLAALDEELSAKLAEYNRTFDAIMLASEALTEAELSVRRTFIPQISELGSRFFSQLTDGRYGNLGLSADLGISCRRDESSSPITDVHFSGGSYALAWFCLRLALCLRISGDSPLPMILDEPFVYFDDRRLSLAMLKLNEIAANGIQILLFSASGRERDSSGDELNTINM